MVYRMVNSLLKTSMLVAGKIEKYARRRLSSEGNPYNSRGLGDPQTRWSTHDLDIHRRGETHTGEIEEAGEGGPEYGGKEGVVEPGKSAGGTSCPTPESKCEKAGDPCLSDKETERNNAAFKRVQSQRSVAIPCTSKDQKKEREVQRARVPRKEQEPGLKQVKQVHAWRPREDEKTQWKSNASTRPELENRKVPEVGEGARGHNTARTAPDARLKTDNPDVLQPQPGFIKTKEEQDYSFIKVEYNKWNTQRNKEGALMQLTTTYLKFFQVFQGCGEQNCTGAHSIQNSSIFAQ
ncbi:hypothetical protein BY996DRAFT_6595219 [Phakopsora pachyrhizi]|nr:hypothetical protein BY996DRAFT_6595219 [Phakopsora pachyrhizi]